MRASALSFKNTDMQPYKLLLNGQPCKVTPFYAVFHKVEKHLAHWQNAYQNERRQVLMVVQQGFTIYIDNNDGYGWHMLTELKGFATPLTRKIRNLALLANCPDEDVHKTIIPERQAADADQLIDYIHDNYPYSAPELLTQYGLYKSAK